MSFQSRTSTELLFLFLIFQTLFLEGSAAGVAKCHKLGNGPRLISVVPTLLLDPSPFGYRHITLDRFTRTAHCAGQVALNLQGKVIGNTIKEQLKSVEGNLRLLLKAVQAKQEDILHLRTYIVEFDSSVDAQDYIAYTTQLGSPASSLVGVNSLGLGSFLVEAEITIAVSPAFIRSLICKK